MSDYADSFFFMLDLNYKNGEKFDWFDNPFVAANVYEYSSES